MAQSSEIKLNKRFDQNIEVTGTIKIGVREQTSAGDYVSNKLTLIPPYHTGGPFNIRTRDDASSAFISIAYGSNEVATIKHDGTMAIGSNTVIHTGNIGSYALTSYSETSTLDSVADRGRTTNQQLISTNPAGFRVDSGSYARIELDSTDNWSYVRLQDQGVTTWDIACYNSGNLEWRPGGGETNRMTLSQSGYLTINGSMKVVGGVIDMNNNDGFVYDDGSNIMYVKLDGTNREIIHSANIGSYALTSLPSHSHQQLSGFANQTEYDVITSGNLNGLRMKARWDSATADRWWDLGFIDGFGTFYSGLKVYNNGNLTYKGNTVIDSSSIGSQSVSNSDKLDGLHASSFVRSDADDTVSGSINFSGGTTRIGNGGYDLFINGGVMLRDYTNSAATNGRFYYQGDAWYFRGGGEGEADATTDTAMYIRSSNGFRKVWHEGNDGSGSGLDADTLDGYHASSFFINGGLTLNMSNDDGLVYNDTNNIMYVKADGSQYPILDSRGGTVNGTITAAGGINMNNTNISGVNHITINDSGAGEGIEWVGGSGWKIYESGNNLDNTSGNLQFVTGSTRRMTLNTSGILEVFGDRIEINGKYARDFKNYKWISGGGSYYSGSAQGWTKVAEVTIAGNCSGNVMYGRMYMRNYHEVQMYDIAVVTRGECDFTTNNESHFIEMGCTAVAGSQFIDYKDHIRAVLVESSTNLRKYEIQFYETPWNDNWWELWTSGFTIYDTPQAPGSSTGTPQIRYQSRMSADTLWADNSMYAPQYYDRDNTAYYLDPHVSSNLAKLILNGTGTGNAATLKVNNSSSSTWNHSIEAFAANMTAGENNLIMTGKQGNDRNAGYMSFHWEADSSNNNFVGIGLWNYDNLFRVYPDQITGSSSFRAPIFYDLDNTAYYLNPAGISNINELHGSGKEIFDATDDSYLRINQSASFSSGCWFGNSQILQSSNRYIATGGNGGTTSSRVYIYGGTYTGTNVIKIDGNSGIIQTTTDSVRAPRFYDYNNTAYYCDPAGTSIFETLNVRPGSNGAGAKINFSDHAAGAYAQNGTLEYVHADSASYGSGNAFKFYGSEASMSFHVAGQGLFTGDIVAYYSDMRLKTKIGDIQDPIAKIKALNGFYYEPNEKALEYGYEKERRIGLSAQEVQEVVPEAVTMAAIGDNYLSVDYAKLVPVLVEAIKELSNKVEELENKLNGTEL